MPVAGRIIAAAAAGAAVNSLSLPRPLVRVGAVVAGPAAEPDVIDWDEESRVFWAEEELVALEGTVAYSFTYCRALGE